MELKEIEEKEVLSGKARILRKVCDLEVDIESKPWKVTQICLDVDKNVVED